MGNNKQFNAKKISLYKNRFEFLLKHHKEGKILDVGNLGGIEGKGETNSFHLNFREKVKNSEIFGVDLFEPAKDKKYLYPNQTKHNLEKGLPFEDNFFDTVYAGQILEHIKNHYSLLQEIKRVLKKDGVFICDMPNPYSLTRILKYLLTKKEHLGDTTHTTFLTPASWRKTLTEAGFKITKIATDWKERLNWLPFSAKKGLGSHLMFAVKKD